MKVELEEKDIPALLGAIELGIMLENWCAAIVQRDLNTYDTASIKWARRVESARRAIEAVAARTTPDKEYGNESVAITLLDEYVDRLLTRKP